jgi:cyclopropane-fatty-acyl-phospholipid synthase
MTSDTELSDSAIAPGLRIGLPVPPRSAARAAVARAMIARAARKLPFLVTGPGGEAAGKPGKPQEPDGPREPELRLNRPEPFYQRVGSAGLVGLGESYQAGDWDSDDLAGLLSVFAAGVDTIVPRPLQWVRGHRVARRRPAAETPTADGARRNARHHYALPNDLFLAFLDETMCYSSAIFETGRDGAVAAGDDALAGGQRRKLDRLLDLAGVTEGSTVLEIGTGWGELPVRAARRGATVHTLTNMAEHAARARERAQRCGVSRQIEVELGDYRDLAGRPGGYDAIVSVEMVEAVGRAYWPAYFGLLDRLLAPGGRIGLQCMTMPHHRMRMTNMTHTWIDKHIFPGGLIPSERAIRETLARHTGLRVGGQYTFGRHYRETLRIWRDRFNRNWPAVAALGFDETFRRTWNFYLAYCEAGFAAGYLDVHQFLLIR